MTATNNWRRLLTYAAIDVMLMVAAGSAVAAPVGATPADAMPVLPTLLVLGVGLCGAGWGRRPAR